MNSVLSVVIPAYNEATVIRQAAEAICEVLRGASIPFEIIFVDDGSQDGTWQEITALASADESIAGVRFSKNFGKESAILSGLAHARGDACAVMDCDMQHPPKVLVEMYELWRQGNVDVVEGVKKSRGREPLIYKGFAAFFYYIVNKFGSINLRDASDFQLLDRKVVNIIIALPERQRFFRALSAWVGFLRAKVSFHVEPRAAGISKFNFRKSYKYAVTNITSFTSAPMQFVTFMGVLFFIMSVALGIHTLHGWLTQRVLEGFTTVILLLLVIGSMLMVSIGIIGLYIGKIYEEIKNRPVYLVSEKINIK